MATFFSPFVKDILGYAIETAKHYAHAEVLPAHFLWALLQHSKHGYARAYLEQNAPLIAWEAKLLTEMVALPALPTAEPVLAPVLEMVLKEAYTEAQDFQSEVILPEYIFLALLKLHPFEEADYAEAKAFIETKTTRLHAQHTEINWAKQDLLLRLLRALHILYDEKKILLKPYLHQAYNATQGEIRGFVLLIDEAQKANKITIELVESVLQEQAIEQTLRFLAHRKYPLEEAFLFLYDTGEWAKVIIAPKEIIVDTQNPSQSTLLGIDLKELLK